METMPSLRIGQSPVRAFRSEVDDEYIRTLSQTILTRARVIPAARQAVRVLQQDLARGIVNAYNWNALLQVVDDASVHAAIRAVILAINRS